MNTEQLRDLAHYIDNYFDPKCSKEDAELLRNTADEIERLRTENERLRSLIGEWAYSADERAIHLRSGDLSESIDKRHYDACEALVKAVGFPRLARQEFETDDLRRDLPA
ncbi:unannotated protein [freshwater metagenome]|uniref:Unannotated protein n=1 Tax=freshwater metagenome TaxID=449393 RepID=A0A6J7EQM9_9ZZZZ|nr:hypothetical protein [Actinomycetota bacterium]